MVIVEELIKQPDAPAKAHLIYSGCSSCRRHRAIRPAVQARDRDRSSATDPELAGRLGIRAGGDDAPDINSEVVDGKVSPILARDDEEEAARSSAQKSPSRRRWDGLAERRNPDEDHSSPHPCGSLQSLRQTIGGGILMYGPPGCGKTHLARAPPAKLKLGHVDGINDVLEM